MIFLYISYQGDQNSPGIIPLAIKDVFSIIQDVCLPDLFVIARTFYSNIVFQCAPILCFTFSFIDVIR